MNIEVRENDYCKLTIHYVAEPSEISDKKKEVLKIFKKAPVPGFRAGKANIEAIKIHYRSQIEDALKRALTEDAYHNTLFEKKLRPYGMPQIQSALLFDNKFICDFNLSVKPDFELQNYRNFELPTLHEVNNSVDLTEKMMQELRVKYGTATPYSEMDFIQVGDNIIINYEGFVDGNKVDALCHEGEMFTVGNSQLKDFDNSLLGMAVDEEREFDLLVPEDGLPSLSGKMVHFKVKLLMGAKNEPCALDDELAHKLQKKDLQELREIVKNTAEAKVREARRIQLNDAICNVLVNNHDFKVPEWLILAEAKYLASQSKLEWNNIQDIDKEAYLKMSEKNVKVSLILDRVREVEPEAQISDQEVFQIIKEQISKSERKSTPEEIIQEMNKTGYLQVLSARIKDEFVLDFITKTVRFIE